LAADRRLKVSGGQRLMKYPNAFAGRGSFWTNKAGKTAAESQFGPAEEA